MADVNTFIEQIEDMEREHNFEMDQTVELVLELHRSVENDEMECGYYFVDHRTRCLFWLHEYDISEILEEVKGASSPSHISTGFASRWNPY